MNEFYLSYFGLNQRPFTLLPDPEFLYWSDQHRRGYAVLEYGIMSRAPITILTGEIGAGKTTLLQKLLGQVEAGVTIGLLVADSYVGFMTFLGIISLSGIVINNAIVLLDRIIYAHAHSTTRHAEVRFLYEDRPDSRAKSFGGALTLLTQRLKRVQSYTCSVDSSDCAAEGSLYSDYALEYHDEPGTTCRGDIVAATDKPRQSVLRRVWRHPRPAPGAAGLWKGGHGMNVLMYLVPAALLLGGIGLAAFLWSLRSGQFDDPDGDAERILLDDD